MIVAALCSGMSYGGTPDGVVGTLCFWRFLLGLGIGGNYPLRFSLSPSSFPSHAFASPAASPTSPLTHALNRTAPPS
jgi:hypothetical protein